MRNLSISLRGTEKNCDNIRIHMAAAYELRKVTKITTSWFNLLWFPYRTVPKADDLYLLICIVVILIQFRDAAHIASHFLQLGLDNTNLENIELRRALLVIRQSTYFNSSFCWSVVA